MYHRSTAFLIVLSLISPAWAQSGLKIPDVTPGYMPPCPQDVRVWVNTRSGVYHPPGSKYYGHTATGEYMCKKAADTAVYKQTPDGD